MAFLAADSALTWAGVFLGVLDIDVVELELLLASSFSVDKDLLSGDFLVLTSDLAVIRHQF